MVKSQELPNISQEKSVYSNFEIIHIIVAGLLGGVLALIPLLRSIAVYYRDDMQAQYMPMFYAIGSTLVNDHSLPFLTTQTWFGGNIIGEFQYAIFNPIELGLYCFLPFIGSLTRGAAFLAVVHSAIFASGSFFLARNMGVFRGYAYVAAIAIVTNNFIYCWFSTSWFPDFTSLTYMMWALAFALNAFRSRWYFIATVLATFLTITAGFPQTVVMTGLFIFIYSGVGLFKYKDKLYLLPLWAYLLGIIVSALSFLPLIGMLATGTRDNGIYNNGFLVPALSDLLFVSNPIHPSRMLTYAGYSATLQSIFYVAWFIVPALCFIDWKAVRNLSVPLLSTIIFCGISFILTQGPEHIGPFRYSIRFIPYFQITLIVSVIILWSLYRLKNIPKSRYYMFFSFVFLAAILSVQETPQRLGDILLSSIFLALAGFAMTRPLFKPLIWAVVTIIFLVISRASAPYYNNAVADWGVYVMPQKGENLDLVPNAYAISVLDNPFISSNANRYDELWFGNMGLAMGRASINGYSPIGQHALVEKFFSNVQGMTYPDASLKGLELEPTTQVSFFDLMRVQTIVVEHGRPLDLFMAANPLGWKTVYAGQYANSFSRPLLTASLPGSLSWPVQGINVSQSASPHAEREVLTISSREKGVNRLVFARTYWRGYHATFNGQTVPVTPLAGFLVSVDLPDDASTGTLVLSFRPPFFRISIGLLMLGLVAIIITLVRGHFGEVLCSEENGRFEKPLAPNY